MNAQVGRSEILDPREPSRKWDEERKYENVRGLREVEGNRGQSQRVRGASKRAEQGKAWHSAW